MVRNINLLFILLFTYCYVFSQERVVKETRIDFFEQNPLCKMYADSSLNGVPIQDIRALIVTGDSVLKNLVQFSNLQFVRFENCELQDFVQVPFGRNLEYIEIHGGTMNNDFFKKYIENENLTSISVENTNILGKLTFKSFSMFENLKKIRLVNINLITSPICARYFEELRILNLSHNNITKLKKEVLESSSLMYLYLRGNDIKKIPKVRNFSNSIVEIDFSENPNIKEISLCNLSEGKIRELSFENCNLSFFPDCLVNMDFLVGLDLTNNNIDFISDKLNRLRSKDDLWIILEGNSIKQLPDISLKSNIVLFK